MDVHPSTSWGMINYARTEWYGFGYFIRCNGSLLPRCLPAIIVAGLISGFVASGLVDDHFGVSMALEDTFGQSYAMQLLGVVFGFLSVTRLNVSYQRYWEGISTVKTMHSKWIDAAVQVLTFDSTNTKGTSCGDDAFRQHVCQLFCQLSAMATITLHLDAFTSFECDDPHDRVLVRRLCHYPPGGGPPQLRTAASLSQTDRQVTRRRRPASRRENGEQAAPATARSWELLISRAPSSSILKGRGSTPQGPATSRQGKGFAPAAATITERSQRPSPSGGGATGGATDGGTTCSTHPSTHHPSGADRGGQGGGSLHAHGGADQGGGSLHAHGGADQGGGSLHAHGGAGSLKRQGSAVSLSERLSSQPVKASNLPLDDPVNVGCRM